MSEQTAVERLKAIGLTENEAKLYLALLLEGSNAKVLSRKAGVPYSKVHTVLAGLMQKSLVVERQSRPTLYEARSGAEGLAEYRRSKADKLEAQFKAAEEALQETVAATDQEKSDVWIIKNQEEILRRVYQSLNGARKEVKVALPVLPDWGIPVLTPIVTMLRSEDVPVKMLLPLDLEGREMEKLRGLVEFRYRDKMFGGGIIVDDREVLLFIGSGGKSVSMAIWSSNAGLVHVAKTYFDYLWGSAGEDRFPADH